MTRLVRISPVNEQFTTQIENLTKSNSKESRTTPVGQSNKR